MVWNKALLLCVIALCGCAKAPSYCPPTDGPVPDLPMVRSHVEANWSDYRERIQRIAGWRSRSFALGAVENVECQPYFGAANCNFDVVARLADGGLERIGMFNQFEIEDDGSLTEVIVWVHELRR